VRGIKKRLLQYGISALIGISVSLFIMNAQGLFALLGSNAATYSILCDAFFVPAAVFLSVGALIRIAASGFFDSVSYAVRVAAHAIVPFAQSKPKAYYDYKSEKAENRGAPPTFILHTGAAFLVVSLIFLAIYSSM